MGPESLRHKGLFECLGRIGDLPYKRVLGQRAKGRGWVQGLKFGDLAV